MTAMSQIISQLSFRNKRDCYNLYRVKGDNVSVDFFLIFTRYTDTTAFTTYDVTKSFERHLVMGRIGKFAAVNDGFTIEEVHLEAAQGTSIPVNLSSD